MHAVYAVARTIDDLSDRSAGNRTTALRDFHTDLHRIWDGDAPQRPALRALAPIVRAHGLSPEPFDRLIEAGLTDQRVTRYETFD
ncbi:squalene/phytoene synthase family protein [Mycobacterium riyadhense]|uniref:squalene/phytoene synthase family protein n=1 Tax=Mycobacterium riyadhense TaxID=486698 RepID=UPI0021F39A42|nr:squalene/phytoene synthase family protein [Mycobacterium riyadhense]